MGKKYNIKRKNNNDRERFNEQESEMREEKHKKSPNTESKHPLTLHMEFSLHRAASLVVATTYAPKSISTRMNEITTRVEIDSTKRTNGNRCSKQERMD